jgi:hypothetical protein
MSDDATNTTDSPYRIEHDTMGEVRVPADALWRAQTQRAVENFPISGRTLEPSHIAALGQIKAAAENTRELDMKATVPHSDHRGTAEYRKAMAGVLFTRALNAAVLRRKGEAALTGYL